MSINFNKEQKFNFNLEKSEIINKVFMGIGWDPADEDEDVDLDASCVLLNADKEVLEVIDFGNLTSEDESVEHLGDNLTGEGDGDDEVINVDLKNLSPEVDSLVFTITSFSGQSFEDIDLSRRVVHMVVSPNDMGDLHVNIIHHHTKVVSWRTVWPSNDQVVQFFIRNFNQSLDLVHPRNHAIGWILKAKHRLNTRGNGRQCFTFLRPPGPIVLWLFLVFDLLVSERIQLLNTHVTRINSTLASQKLKHLLVPLDALHLIKRSFIRPHSKPFHALQYHIDRLLG